MKRKKVLKWIILGIAIAINVFIIVNAFINGEASAKESNNLAHTTADVINAVKEYGEPDYIDDEIFVEDDDEVGENVDLFGNEIIVFIFMETEYE